MMKTPISAEEVAWAQDCIRAGDTLAEVAEWSGLPAEAWRLALGLREDGLSPVALGRDVTPRERFIVAAARADISCSDIGRRLGISPQRVRQLALRLEKAGLLLPRRRSGTVERPSIDEVEAAGVIDRFHPEERRAA